MSQAMDSGVNVRISLCEVQDGWIPWEDTGDALLAAAIAQKADLLVLNEMPVGKWLASDPRFDPVAAGESIRAHDMLIATLQDLPFATLSSRPVRSQGRLANEAFLTCKEQTRALHQKHYFPQEEGYWEESWFDTQCRGFAVAELRRIRIGVLLCTELMFTEWARHYRHQGAHVIAVPRASGASVRTWHAAAAMAAVVSGCYVISSNRAAGAEVSGKQFGGRGFVFSPLGELIAETSPDQPLLTVEVDLGLVEQVQCQYPCNVKELSVQR